LAHFVLNNGVDSSLLQILELCSINPCSSHIYATLPRLDCASFLEIVQDKDMVLHRFHYRWFLYVCIDEQIALKFAEQLETNENKFKSSDT
jgi:hypothetical protein